MDWQEAMFLALDEASEAARSGDVPVGAVVLDGDGALLARNHNRREADRNPTAHAEMLVLGEAAVRLGGWRLLDTTVVVTLEPCVMCAGAMVLARVGRVVIGARDPKGGAIESLYHLAEDQRLNHQMQVVSGILADEASTQLKRFFHERRHN